MIPVRLIALGVVGVALMVGIRGAYQTAWQSGYDAAQLEVSRGIQARIDAAVERERQQWENLTEIAEDTMTAEIQIVEVERIVEREIPVVVEKIVERTPECSDLGIDFIGLLNQQVTAGTGANPTNLRENPAESDAGM